LVDRVVRGGDEHAFGVLYDHHTPYLYRMALRLTGGDAAHAADLVHDAWVAAAPRFASFAWASTFRTWLAGFVVNIARRDWRDAPLPLSLDHGSEAPAFDAAVLARIDVERALAGLPPGARQVLVLHDMEGWTHVQIAQQLSVDVGTSKSQLSRARALMRVQLRSHEDAGGHP
jgi:RNA polymerase sigma-70 factor (ECF subfamily)